MAEERVQRAVYIETALSETGVWEEFSKCGEILHTWRVGAPPNTSNLFLEFAHQSSVGCAKSLTLKDCDVHVVATSAQLASRLKAVASTSNGARANKRDFPEKQAFQNAHIINASASEKKKRHLRGKRGSGVSSSKLESASGNIKPRVNLPPVKGCPPSKCAKEKENIGEMSSAIYPDIGGLSSSRSSTHGTAAGGVYSPPHNVSTTRRENSGTTLPSQVNIKAESTGDPPLTQTLFQSRRAPSSPVESAQALNVSSPTAIASLSHGGDQYLYVLDELSKDPVNAITVLTKTSAHATERDKWMIVAGHCRRRDNIRAAISVLTAMVDVMTSPDVGLAQDDLRPAYLMLASCYTDLSRKIPDFASEEATLAKAKATEYFQVVYGSRSRESKALDTQPSPSRVDGTKESQLQTSATQSPMAVDRPTTGQKRQNSLPSEAMGRLQSLEREIRSLRDRQTNHLTSLSDIRAAKHKLEEELHTERNLRRKTEQELTNTAAELEGARRSAKYALEQCKREVDNRRRIEDRAVELRVELAEIKIELDAGRKDAQDKDRKTRECFSRLGSLFARAADGELEDHINPILRGSNWSPEAVPYQPGRPLKRQRPESG